MAVNPLQSAAPPFRWETGAPSPGVATITTFGELDLATVPELEKAFARVEAGPDHMIVLDLRPLAFLDLAGARSMVAADARARLAGRALHVLAGPPAERVFSLARFDELSILDA